MMWVVTSSIGSGEVISGWRLVVQSARLSVMELVGREAVLVSLYLPFGSPNWILRLYPLFSIASCFFPNYLW